MRGVVRALATAAIATVMTGMAVAGANAAPAADDPTVSAAFKDTSVTSPYGLQGEGGSWFLEADVTGDLDLKHYKLTSVTMTGTPSGYSPEFTSFRNDDLTFTGYVFPPSGKPPLPKGSYTVTATFTDQDGAGTMTEVTPPATLTITPAELTVVCAMLADPSNPANAIVTADLTGDFFTNSFSFSFPDSPVTPGGAWVIRVTDAGGAVVHEFSATREEGDDVSGVSSYWPDVSPGEYTARATFTPSGQSAQNFAVTQAAAVSYSPAPQPGATSTAEPAPPAPPPAKDGGMTLPGWIPLVAGILAAGLLALTIVQIVRLTRLRREAGRPERMTP